MTGKKYRPIGLARGSAGLILFCLVVVYAALAYFIEPVVLIEIGDAFSIVMSAAAFWVYGRALMVERSRRPDYVDLLILGIFGGWLTNFLDRIMRLASRMFDANLLGSPLIGALLLMLTFFAGIHVLVKGAATAADREMNFNDGWRWVGIALGIGFLLSVVIISFKMHGDPDWDYLLR